LALVPLQALEVVKQLGPFSHVEQLQDSSLGEVMDSWLDTLQQHQQQQQGGADVVPLPQWQLVGPGQRQAWPAGSVWYGLKVLLGLLEVRKAVVGRCTAARSACHGCASQHFRDVWHRQLTPKMLTTTRLEWRLQIAGIAAWCGRRSRGSGYNSMSGLALVLSH
jgi:hypothetical protein